MDAHELQALLKGGEAGAIEGHLHAIATERGLPLVSMAACLARIEEAGPPLRALLARAAEGDALSENEETLLFRGLYILAGARDDKAFQPLLRLLHLPDDAIDALLGDAITDNLAQIAASLFDGDSEALFEAITDLSLDQFIREALFGAATFLAWDGRIAADRMRQFLERFYLARLAPDEDEAWVGWVEAIGRLGLRDLAPLVHAAWDEGRIPDWVLERRHFEDDLRQAERAPRNLERLKKANLGYIADLYDAVGWTDYDESADEGTGGGGWGAVSPTPIPPVTNPWRRVGRNDPCPCGSGKKAKKCCLAD